MAEEGVLAEPVTCCAAQGKRPAALLGEKTLLGWRTSANMQGKKFSKVVLMGPYWSGTNAIREEVSWRFSAPVLNPDKLEVCASTPSAMAALRRGLASGTTLQEPVRVGKKLLPKGYKLLPRAREQPLAEEHAGLLEALASGSEPVVAQFSPETDGSCPWWKHAVHHRSHGEMTTDSETLVIMVTKDPLFWLHSVSKHFYEMRVPGEAKRAGLQPLFGELWLEGRSYCDALELWEVSMAGFLDESLYPSSRCVLLRYEDFLFHFWDVMVHLAAFLPANGQRLKEPPTSSRSKIHGRDVRGRDEALRFYARREHRFAVFTPEQLERLGGVPSALLEQLGYEGAPLNGAASGLCPWVPRLLAGDIVAAQLPSAAPGAGDEGEEEAAPPAPCRVWGAVAADEAHGGGGDSVSLELLDTVPREWLQDNVQDWSTVEWPPPPSKAAAEPPPRPGVLTTLPREALELRLPQPRADFRNLPLTEEGYRAVVGLRSTRKMGDFIARVIAQLEVHGSKSGRVVNRQGLLGFARWFSGEATVQCLAQIRRELPGKEREGWLVFVPPKPDRHLGE